MKWIIILSLLFPFSIRAACHLTSDKDPDGNLVLRCTKGFMPRNVLCRDVRRTQFGGQIFDVQIVAEPDASWTGTLKEWLGLNAKDWTPEETLEEGEKIICTVNESRLETLRSAEANKRQIKRQKELDEIDRLQKINKAKQAFCQRDNKPILERILCAEWRMEALSE